MTTELGALLESLRADSWRIQAGFSPDIETANRELFQFSAGEAGAVRIINDWIAQYQPCLFGKLAARVGLLSHCIITEDDLLGPEQALLEKVQSARTEWKREGLLGRKSGFVISVISERIARSIPDESVKTLALRLCGLYLLDEILPDKVFLDDLLLEMPGPLRTTWKWDTGINYFSSHGDRRWWHDHRFPGGIGFSINSIGHMVKSGMMAKHISDLAKLMGAPEQGLIPTRIDSPEDALGYAMLTIDNASDAVSGRATELLPLPTDPKNLPVSKCPAKLPKIVEDKNFCEYKGYYHTDYTIPSEYFVADVERPSGLSPHRLDFTYLFDDDPLSADRLRLKEGVRVRGVQTSITSRSKTSQEAGPSPSKRGKAHGRPAQDSNVAPRPSGHKS